MLKTILMAVVGFSLLWLALVAELAAYDCGDNLSVSLPRSAQERLCAEVAASITEEDVRAPRYSAVGTVEGTEPRLEAVSPRVVGYRGLQGHVVDMTGVQGSVTDCTRAGRRSPLDFSTMSDEHHAELMASICRRLPCRQDVRSYYGYPPCGPLDRAMAKEGM